MVSKGQTAGLYPVGDFASHTVQDSFIACLNNEGMNCSTEFNFIGQKQKVKLEGLPAAAPCCQSSHE